MALYDKISKSMIPTGNFTHQTGTYLHRTGSNFEFLVGDCNDNGIPDVYCIKKK